MCCGFLRRRRRRIRIGSIRCLIRRIAAGMHLLGLRRRWIGIVGGLLWGWSLAYRCDESELREVSLRSVKGAIALCYYFISCGLKAQREYLSSPAGDLSAVQRLIYDELPPSFETRQGVEIAVVYGMPERSFKRWLAMSYFKKVSYGFYEKRFS